MTVLRLLSPRSFYPMRGRVDECRRRGVLIVVATRCVECYGAMQ
jgi:hypothetical protein